MHERHDERGFVLVASLVILMILTVMLIGLYFRGKTNQESSVSSRDSTKGYYLAETGLNYIAFALHADPNYPSGDSTMDLDGNGTSDRLQLQNNPDQASLSASSRLGYLDLNNTIGFDPSNPTKVNLLTLTPPPHVTLDITTNSQNVPSISQETWSTASTQHPSGDGAIVWLVPAVLNANDPTLESDSTSTSGSYALFAYSIGYVNGKPKRMLRAEVATLIYGYSTNLGATTNAYKN